VFKRVWYVPFVKKWSIIQSKSKTVFIGSARIVLKLIIDKGRKSVQFVGLLLQIEDSSDQTRILHLCFHILLMSLESFNVKKSWKIRKLKGK